MPAIMCARRKTSKSEWWLKAWNPAANSAQTAARKTAASRSVCKTSVWTQHVEAQMCVPVYTEWKVIEKVWLSPQEFSAAQWEMCYYWNKHFTFLPSTLFISLFSCITFNLFFHRRKCLRYSSHVGFLCSVRDARRCQHGFLFYTRGGKINHNKLLNYSCPENVGT